MTFDSTVPLPAAVAVAGVIALAAHRRNALTTSGAAAALGTGTIALAHRLGWGTFLILWFLIAVVLSRIGRAQKAQRTRDIVEKGDRRDARQVLANGGAFAAGAAWSMLAPMTAPAAEVVAVAAAAALVAAGADTWATELGTLGGGRPWSLRQRRRVAIGTSGAVTPLGTMASAVGAFVLASLAGALDVIPQAGIAAVALGGVAGAFADTLIGAWWQERRWCPRCSDATEQRVHACGTATEHRGGVGALTNDAVNLLCTLAGAAVAAAVWSARGP